MTLVHQNKKVLVAKILEFSCVIFHIKVVLIMVQKFLAAMSSSRSDVVTQFVRSFVRSFVRLFVRSFVRVSVHFFLLVSLKFLLVLKSFNGVSRKL